MGTGTKRLTASTSDRSSLFPTMSCTDNADPILNALHSADDESAPVITCEYAAYMN